MRIQPLLAALMMELSPQAIMSILDERHLLGGRRFNSYWGSFSIKQTDDVLHVGGICEKSLELNSIAVGLHNYSPKQAAIYIGYPIDVFLDIPLAHRTRITEIADRRIYFECLDDPIPLKDCPIHTAESFSKREITKSLDIIFKANIHWLVKRAFDSMSEEDLSRLELDTIHHYGYSTSISGFQLDDKHIKKINVPFDGSLPSVEFNNAKITGNALTVKGQYPDSAIMALHGKPARTVLDHWLLDDVVIRSAKKMVNGVKVHFAAPTRATSYMKDQPERANRVLEIANAAELKATPEALIKFRAGIIEKDQGRCLDREDEMLYIHHKKTLTGTDRSDLKRPVKKRRKGF